VAGAAEVLRLARRGSEYSIAVVGKPGDLMNSRAHGSEEELARLGLAAVLVRGASGGPKSVPNGSPEFSPRILVGGLGMGFTLAAVLRELDASATGAASHRTAEVLVAELVPEVVEWNRGELGECAGRPLDDERVAVRVGDVGAVLAEAGGPRGIEKFDGILLDVDNGPEGFASEANNGLYSSKGLAVARAALREGGVLAVWSASPDAAFSERLRRAGFAVAEHRVRAQGGKGSRHQVWVATRGSR